MLTYAAAVLPMRSLSESDSDTWAESDHLTRVQLQMILRKCTSIRRIRLGHGEYIHYVPMYVCKMVNQQAQQVNRLEFEMSGHQIQCSSSFAPLLKSECVSMFYSGHSNSTSVPWRGGKWLESCIDPRLKRQGDEGLLQKALSSLMHQTHSNEMRRIKEPYFKRNDHSLRRKNRI